MGKKAQNNTALVRLRRDYMRLKTDPVPYISAEPLPSNILEWCVASFVVLTMCWRVI